MKANIQEILNEIYDIDPTLKGREDELKKALQKMLEVKPMSKIDENFKNDLRQRLYVEAKYGSRNKFDFKNLIQVLTSFAVGGAVAGLSVMFVLNSNDFGNDKNYMSVPNNSPGSMMLSGAGIRGDDGIDNSRTMLKSAITEDIQEDDFNLERNEFGAIKEGANILDGDNLDTFMMEALEEAESMPEADEIMPETSVESFTISDDVDFDETIELKKLEKEEVVTEQKDISGKPPQLYKYSFSGEFPELKKEYKYYKITTLNMGTTSVEEETFTPKTEEVIKLNLDIERMISSYMPPDSEAYKEIIYKDVEFTYIREYKMKSEYLIPALWFKGSRYQTKGETFKMDQFIPLINIKELK